jgi:hypothetical protein
VAHEQGVSKAGNPRLRRSIVATDLLRCAGYVEQKKIDKLLPT